MLAAPRFYQRRGTMVLSSLTDRITLNVATAPTTSRMALPDAMIPKAILEEFQTHCTSLRHAYNARKEAVVLKNVVEDRQDREAISVEDTLGKRQPTDKYEGDVNLRTLRLLLKMIDERGWERSDHQISFHSAFERCVSRVLYKNEWATQRPAIMKHNGWDRCSSEVMIS
jgi:hypothetical protein